MIDEVPEGVLRAARAAFDRREPGAVVADLVDDWIDVVQPQGAVRRLRFASPHLDVDLDVRPIGDALVLLVSVRPPSVVDVEARHPGELISTQTMANGQCDLAPVRHGLVSLLVKPVGPGALPPTQTAWVVL